MNAGLVRIVLPLNGCSGLSICDVEDQEVRCHAGHFLVAREVGASAKGA